MEIGIIVICLIILAFATGLYRLSKIDPDWKKNDEAIVKMTLAILLTFFMLGVTVMMAFMVADIATFKQNIPETETSDIVDSTTAPDEPSMPTPSEPIHNDISPTTPETTPVIDPDELEMLACVIYQEAGGSKHCDECRRRVADVVLNRIADKRFPDNMHDVLTAKNQYGRFHWTGIVWPERHTWPGEKNQVARAYRIAEEVLSGQHSDVYGKGYVYQAEFVQGDEGFWCCGHYFGKT